MTTKETKEPEESNNSASERVDVSANGHTIYSVSIAGVTYYAHQCEDIDAYALMHRKYAPQRTRAGYYNFFSFDAHKKLADALVASGVVDSEQEVATPNALLMAISRAIGADSVTREDFNLARKEARQEARERKEAKQKAKEAVKSDATISLNDALVAKLKQAFKAGVKRDVLVQKLKNAHFNDAHINAYLEASQPKARAGDDILSEIESLF